MTEWEKQMPPTRGGGFLRRHRAGLCRSSQAKAHCCLGAGNPHLRWGRCVAGFTVRARGLVQLGQALAAGFPFRGGQDADHSVGREFHPGEHLDPALDALRSFLAGAGTSQMRAVPSAEPVSAARPSGRNATRGDPAFVLEHRADRLAGRPGPRSGPSHRRSHDQHRRPSGRWPGRMIRLWSISGGAAALPVAGSQKRRALSQPPVTITFRQGGTPGRAMSPDA